MENKKRNDSLLNGKKTNRCIMCFMKNLDLKTKYTTLSFIYKLFVP